MNSFSCAGRLTRDSELRSTPTGKSVLSFTVASDVGFGERKHPIFVRCSLWGSGGEKLSAYLLKGAGVAATGELDLREWKGQDGVTKRDLELNVDRIAITNFIEVEGKVKPISPPEENDGFGDSVPF
jgi:single-strand DNA-binding protein